MGAHHATLVLVVSSSLACVAWAEEQPQIDKDKIRALVEKLSDDDYSVREKATADLTAMGTAALPVLEDLSKKNHDPEVQSRIRCIIENCALAGVKTLAEATKLHKQYVEQIVTSGGDDAKALERAEKTIQIVARLAGAEQCNKVLAELHYEAGMAYYRMYAKGMKNPHETLKRAKDELEKSTEYFEKHQAKNPKDKGTENRLLEAQMILYACRKYQTLE